MSWRIFRGSLALIVPWESSSPLGGRLRAQTSPRCMFRRLDRAPPLPPTPPPPPRFEEQSVRGPDLPVEGGGS